MSKTPKSDANAAPFEARLERLEAIVRELDDEEVPLDRALALFEEGVGELKAAQAALAQAEATLKVLVEQADGTFALNDLERRGD
jgi:exodeoxyribonuclease VII small subunit